MELKKKIQDLLIEILPREGLEGIVITIKPTENEAFGDFTTSFALENFKILKENGFLSENIKNPKMFSDFIVINILKDIPAWLSRVEVAGPGFINFFVNKPILIEEVLKNAVDKNFVKNKNNKKTKILIEHTSVNPNKAMHIGHLRNAFIGDSLVKVLKKFDYNVEIHNYIDDMGLQVADTTLAFLSLNKEPKLNEAFDDFAWDIYAEINRLYESNPGTLERRNEISKKIEEADGEIFLKSQELVEKILDSHMELLCKLGIKYDLLVYESDIIKTGFWREAFELLKKSPNFYLETEGKQKGCWVLKYKTEKFGNKIFVRANGSIVYVGKDLAYHMWKFGLLSKDFAYSLIEKSWGSVFRTSYTDRINDDKVDVHADRAPFPAFGKADQIITVVDERQEYPQEMVRYGLEALGYKDEYNNYKHLAYGVVNLSLNTAKTLGLDIDDNKSAVAMSGRKGIGIKAKDILNLLLNKIIEQNKLDYESAFKIASGAIKHYMLKYNPLTEIVFDYENALNLKGNTGPYLQYSYARAFSILSKAGDFNYNYVSIKDLDLNAYNLIKLMGEWSDILEKSSKDHVLSRIAEYAFDLSSSFHKFYETNNVLKAEDDVKKFRLTVVESYMNIIEDVLNVMGIETLDKM